MPRFVRFLGNDGTPTWGEVHSADDDSGATGALLRSVPPERDPNYFSRLMDAFAAGGTGPTFHVEPGMILPPVSQPSMILAIGFNYGDHLEEINALNEAEGKALVPHPTEPTVFAKFPGSVIGHDDAIVIPHMAPNKVDYEAELAVVIGRAAKNVQPERALEHVAFYTCGHDVSARDAQLEAPNNQWLRGKSFDSFCPLGPFAVTGIDPGSLDIRLILNGNAMQSSNTRNLIFSVPFLISYLSHNTTLLPGTVIMTGTPGGVGHSMNPPVYLQPGDVVEVDIAEIGRLRNVVADDSYAGAVPKSWFAGRAEPADDAGAYGVSDGSQTYDDSAAYDAAQEEQEQ